MVTKEELKKAIKEVEKSESKKPETSRQTLTLKQQVNTYQDCEPILEENKKSYNNYGDKLPSGKSGDGLRVASIPLNVWQKWKKETNGEIERDSNLLKKYLNDPDNKYFRTTPTRV